MYPPLKPNGRISGSLSKFELTFDICIVFGDFLACNRPGLILLNESDIKVAPAKSIDLFIKLLRFCCFIIFLGHKRKNTKMFRALIVDAH
jgi:hypothetical protein